MTPPSQTELEKAIEHCQARVKDAAYPPWKQLVIDAAKHSIELEQKLNDWSNKELLGETERCRLEAAEKKVVVLEQKLKDLETVLKATSDVVGHDAETIFELQQELSQLREQHILDNGNIARTQHEGAKAKFKLAQLRAQLAAMKGEV